ncbi:MAG TPA: glycosyltransferase family 1 protein, partial [Candidatus Binatia bacterium]|nr:glycosyltransferase family 1 protein [Candidatus Binatia bacterium]
GIGAQVGILGGPGTYARELVTALAGEGRHEYVVFTDRPEVFAPVGVRTVHVPMPTPYHQVTWDHWRLPGLIAAERVALYHGTKNLLPWRLPVPAVVTVHDLAVYAYPETFALPQRWHLKAFLPRSVARAARIVADSAHAAEDLRLRFRLGAGRVAVVPLGVAAAFREPAPPAAVERLRAIHGLGERLIACVGTVQPRKRIERVIEAFVRSDACARGWQLAIAGRLRPGYAPSWLTALPEGATWLGPLPEDALRALYGAAAIAVSASDYEGFGLTVCEAMAGGCAVVAVANSSIPEVVGDAGLLVARSEPGVLADAIRRLVAEPETRAALGAAARARAARFTWEETARRTRAVYEDVVACA